MELPVVEARFRGKCGECRDWIMVGELIVKVGNWWLHEECAEAVVREVQKLTEGPVAA